MLVRTMSYKYFLEFLHGDRQWLIVERRIAKMLNRSCRVELESFNESGARVSVLKRIQRIELNPSVLTNEEFGEGNSAVLYFEDEWI